MSSVSHRNFAKHNADDPTGSLRRGVIWLLIQLTPLALMLLQVPLWARGPESKEALTPIILLSGQTLGSAIFFPWLSRRGSLFLFLIGTGTALQLIATVIAEQTLISWCVHSVILVSWVATLALLANVIISKSTAVVCSALLSALAMLIPFLAPV